MKKIIVLILSIFIFQMQTYAIGEVKHIDVAVHIEDNGVAKVKEVWNIPKQENKKFEKIFSKAEDTQVKNVKISDANNHAYQETENKTEQYRFFSYNKNGNMHLSIHVLEESTLTIEYEVTGMISKFQDVYGINWLLISKRENLHIDQYSLVISSSEPFSEGNTALYAIGNRISLQFVDGNICVNATSIESTHQIRLMTTFSERKFETAIKRNTSFNDAYESALKENKFFYEMLAIAREETLKVLVFVVLFIVLIAVVIKVFVSKNNFDEYSDIVYKKKSLPKLDEVDYNENIPCNGDLYSISFIASYFHIMKNKSDLIGAFLLKWIFEGKATIIKKDGKKTIQINDIEKFNDTIERDLYKMLKQASNFNKIDQTKVSRYARQNYKDIMNWFQHINSSVISASYLNGTIKRIKKRKKVILVLPDIFYEEGVHLQELKKYVLHIHHIPRKKELTVKEFQLMLIVMTLLGMGRIVAEEILRKNPDNEYAKALQELESVKEIYKRVYDIAAIPYRIYVKKDHIIQSNDPETQIV